MGGFDKRSVTVKSKRPTRWRTGAPSPAARERERSRRAQRMVAVQQALQGEATRIKAPISLPKLKFLENDA